MKFILSILLALVLLTESLLPKGVGLSQDFKFGELMTHYQEHKSQYGDQFSFVDFLGMHYSADSDHTKNNHHDNLPCLSGHQLLVVISLPLTSFNFSVDYPFVSSLERQFTCYLNSYHFLFALDFLNPPQFS